MTATADSSLLYVSEGGTIAIIDADDQQSHYDTPIKQVQVGKLAVASSGLLLDPNLEDLLYIAGGRMGLWVMDGDPDPANANPAARVDDSGNLVVTSQNSRRWCNALGTFRLQVDGSPVDYLVALFSKANHTRLRVYELTDVRGVLLNHAGQETDNEIPPIHSTHLDGNATPAWPIGTPPPLPFSFGYGLAVDNPDESRADVYVAMGMHGIVRVTYLPDHFANPSQPPFPAAVDGPVFGDLTTYAAGNDLYGNLDYYENPGPTLFWSEPPFFVDVAVQDFNEGHFLYAAVDHLGWLRFDLDASSWGPDMPIEHHEGVEFDVAMGGQQLVSLLPDPDGQPGGQDPPTMYARKIEVVDRVGNTVVVVTANPRPVRVAIDTITEGYALGYIGGYPLPLRGGWPTYYGGGEPYTLLYRGFTSHSTPMEAQSTACTNAGGCTLNAAPAQSTNPIVFFAGESIPELQDVQDLGYFNTFRGRVTNTNPPIVERMIRDKEHRAGRNNHHTGVFRNSEHQSLLLTGYNDGGFPEDGALWICNDEIKRSYVGVGNQEICSTAIIPNTDAQWRDSPTAPTVWAWGSKIRPPSPGVLSKTLFSMYQFRVGQNLCPGPPTQQPSLVWQAFLEEILDRLYVAPRGHYEGGSVDAGYDAFTETLIPGSRYVFASRHASPDGIVVFRRDRLQADALNLPQSGETIGTTQVEFAHVTDLDTHPEYDNVPDAHSDDDGTDPSNDFLNKIGAAGATGTWSPKLIEDDGGSEPRWLLAVPCYTVSLNPEDPVFTDPMNPGSGGYHPGWAPDQVFADNYTTAMSRVFDVTNPSLPVALATLLGPGLLTSTSDLELLKVGSSYYLFAVGWVDGVSVWDITNLPGGDPVPVYTSTDPRYFAYWQPPKSVTDLEDGNVFDLVIDETPDDEIFVCASVVRAGVQVLKFDPTEPFEDRLVPEKLIQTNARTSGLALRDDGGEKTLIVSDLGAGIRVYGKP